MGTGSLVAVLLIVAWEAFVAYGAWQAMRAPARIATWPTVPARCVDIRRLRRVEGQQGGTDLGWHAVYDYAIDGQSHQTLAALHRPDAPVKQHWLGREATVSVDPRYPHEPTLAVVGPINARRARLKAAGIVLAGQIVPAFIFAATFGG